MIIKTGIDVLDLNRFLSSAKKGKGAFLNRLFTPFEIRNNSPEQLASIFCVKESLTKTFELPYDSWLKINIARKKNGKLTCSFSEEKLAKKIISIDTSVSHEGNIIIAITVAILRK